MICSAKTPPASNASEEMCQTPQTPYYPWKTVSHAKCCLMLKATFESKTLVPSGKALTDTSQSSVKSYLALLSLHLSSLRAHVGTSATARIVL